MPAACLLYRLLSPLLLFASMGVFAAENPNSHRPFFFYFFCDAIRAANPIVTSSPSVSQDEVGELKRRVKKLEDAVAALQAVSEQQGRNGKPHDRS